jgi:hypothetical protein
MNDFTKEELEDLHLVYRTFCTEDGTQAMRKLTNLETGIIDKIQSMIDSYCEHEHKHYGVGDSRPLVMTHECLKCGKEYTK